MASGQQTWKLIKVKHTLIYGSSSERSTHAGNKVNSTTIAQLTF